MMRFARLVLAGLACLTALLPARAARAGEEEALRKEVRRLREAVAANDRKLSDQDARIEALSARQAAQLQQEVEGYLGEQATHASAAGPSRGPLDGVRVSVRFTSVLQGSVELTPADRLVADGDIDLEFGFSITENLEAFLTIVGNTNGASFESQLGPIMTPTGSFGPIGGRTAGALTDGIGLNGAVQTKTGPINIYEAGILRRTKLGDNTLHWELGALDPRRRFSQNRWADDENTQFLNNNFDDSPAMFWLTDSTSRSVFGWHMWIDFGANQEYRLNLGWFNTPGQFFNHGQFLIQFSWKQTISGREMNLRVFGFLDAFSEASAGKEVFGGGVSWDWMINDNVGIFVRVTSNDGAFNPVDLDASLGFVFRGTVGSRPDDEIGIAVGFVSLEATTGGPAGVFSPVEESEITVEVYYKYVLEDGRLQLSPHVMFISNPGGRVAPWADDALFLLGLRLFVPF
ncbi:MAG: carbohydrate porin [Planctomycetaceae bacterium]